MAISAKRNGISRKIASILPQGAGEQEMRNRGLRSAANTLVTVARKNGRQKGSWCRLGIHGARWFG